MQFSNSNKLRLRNLGITDYTPVWKAMQQFTDKRDSDTADEIWFLQHRAVFTQGQAGKAEHLLAPGDIPVIQADRGGQVTYHGPGQLIAYLLLDLKRSGIGVRALVTAIESAIVKLLSEYQIEAGPRSDAPGVYIKPVTSGAKIAQLGLRVRRGCSFHGLSLNVDMDMEPFNRINPCGYSDLEVTSIRMQKEPGLSASSQLTNKEIPKISEVIDKLSKVLIEELGYTDIQWQTDGLLPTF